MSSVEIATKNEKAKMVLKEYKKKKKKRRKKRKKEY